jgi:hypothetical protein
MKIDAVPISKKGPLRGSFFFDNMGQLKLGLAG